MMNWFTLDLPLRIFKEGRPGSELLVCDSLFAWTIKVKTQLVPLNKVSLEKLNYTRKIFGSSS